jgi:hypothetical protein
MKKFLAEGRMEESKQILGWIINTRSLTLALPTEKHAKWTKDINTMISSGKTNHKQLEQLLGRLNHTANILPTMRHFLGCLYRALYRSGKTKWISLKPSEKMDLSLLETYLDYAKEGVSMNNVVFRKPTNINRSDASEFGIGGYNLISGKAWRFELPIDCRLRTTLNSLEFLACMIMIWIDILSNNIKHESCILSQTDSSSAAGWLRKSNFADS